MRTISVNIYKFDELEEEIQDSLVEQALEEIDLNDDIQEFMDQKLAQMGLSTLSVESYSFGDEEAAAHIYLTGELTDSLKYFEKTHISENLSLVKSAFLDTDDVTDDNQCGISIFFKEEVDEETDESAQEVSKVIQEQLALVEEQLLEDAQEFFEKKSQSLANKAKKTLSENEYFADGTLFDADLMQE